MMDEAHSAAKLKAKLKQNNKGRVKRQKYGNKQKQSTMLYNEMRKVRRTDQKMAGCQFEV